MAEDPAADIVDRRLDPAAIDDPLHVHLGEAPAALAFEGEVAALEHLEYRPMADMRVIEVEDDGSYVLALFVSAEFRRLPIDGRAVDYPPRENARRVSIPAKWRADRMATAIDETNAGATIDKANLLFDVPETTE